jgi:preprotein translocase subunit SecF
MSDNSESFVEKLNQAELHYPFLSRKPIIIALTVSALLLLLSLGSLATRGLSFGIDFTGGTLVEVGYQEAVELQGIRDLLQNNGFADAVVQHFGTSRDVIIRLGVRDQKNSEMLSSEILAILKSSGVAVDMRRVEFVGPQVGSELIEKGGLAMLYTLIGILIYVAFRFEYRFALGAVLALMHDTIITLGFFSLFRLEFDLTVLAAILAIIGYSLNDTIVVFDRIRDNFLKLRKSDTREIMNRSINQTLVRSLMTSFTTLLAVVALFVLGGQLIHNFAAALMIGIIIGTYSSIYIASTLTLYLGLSRSDMLPQAKEGALKEGETLNPDNRI